VDAGVSKVLVTGASGFVGGALCARLQQEGWGVRAVMRRPAGGPWDESVLVRLGDEALPAGLLADVDIVFHLAGRTHAVDEGPGCEAQYRRANVQSTLDLLAASEEAGVRGFVYFSSVKAIGEGCDVQQDEDTPPRPTTAYGRTKLEAERAVLAAEGIAHRVVLRPTLVYGPRPKGHLALMIRAVRQGWFPPIPQVGAGRSMIHRDDLIEATLLAAFDPRAAGRTYILSDGRAYTTRQIHEAILRSLGRRPPGWSLPLGALTAAAKAGDWIGRVRGRRFVLDSQTLERLVGSACYSGERIRRELGFSPRHNLIESMPEMVASVLDDPG